MLQIKNLTLTHRKDLRVILEGFNLVLNAGDKAVIIGEEGNGKSTLIKWLYNPELIDDYMDYSGEKVISNEHLAYLPQELPKEDKEKTVYEFFSENEGFFDMSPKELSKLASDYKVEEEFFYRTQSMATLSGGEKVKAQLMRIMIEQPTALLLDEPSNDLDIATLELLEEIITSWQGIVLFISHDETLIENTANMVIHIEQIRRKTKSRYTVAKSGYSEYVRERRNKMDKQEEQALSDRREQKKRDEKLKRIYQSVDFYQENLQKRGSDSKGRLLKKKMHVVKSMAHRFEREDENMTEMPEEENPIFFKLGGKERKIPDGKTVVEYDLPKLSITEETGEERALSTDVFLRIRGSEKICIVGNNGSGKTTFIRKLAGDMLMRSDINVQYMPQNYEDLLELNMTPVEFLKQKGDKEEDTMIRTYLGALKYTADEMEHPIRELSGGQKAKVLLLKMSMSDANVLILDEPTRNFSPLSGPVIRAMLKEFQGAIISISHDRKYIDEVCDKIYELTENGLREKDKNVL